MYAFVLADYRGKINYSWVIPCFPLLMLFAVYQLNPHVNRAKFNCYVGALTVLGIVFGGIFLVRSVYQQPYRKRGCDYENYPGKTVSRIVTDGWSEFSAGSLPYVIANREGSCNVALYSGDKPQAYFSANAAFSQWIDEADIRRCGGVLLWPGDAVAEPPYLQRFRAPDFVRSKVVTQTVPRAVPGWFRALYGKEPKLFCFSYCYLLPAASPRI